MAGKPPIVKAPYEQRRIRNWMEFLEIMTESPYANWAFRGLPDQRWNLISALSRYFRNFRIHPRAWPEQEARILRVFKSKAHHFLSHAPDPDDEFQWLALMQHHGAPTRLIDFTWSPYVAAFFALERATRDAAIWALNPDPISYVDAQTVRDSRTIRPREMDPRLKGNFRNYFLKGNIPFIWIGEPQVMNRRLIAQSGTFAVPGTLNEPIEKILSGYPNPKNILVKFILPRDEIRDKGMRELYRMKITHESMFPDLDGLARSLAYELEFHWAYDPRSLKSYLSHQKPRPEE